MSTLTSVLKARRVKVEPLPFRLPAPLLPVSEMSPEAYAVELEDEGLLPPRPQESGGRHITAEAYGLLEAARNEAGRIMRAAESQRDEIRRAAQSQGLEEGRAEGHSAAYVAAQPHIQSVLQLAEKVLEESRRWRDDLLVRSEEQLLELVNEVARKLFGDGTALPAEQMKAVVYRALQRARSLGQAQIRLHPEDAELLRPDWPERLPLIPDESILRGGCVVEATRGSVDARVETQLARIGEAMNETGGA